MTRNPTAPQAMTAIAFIFCAFFSSSSVYAQSNGADGLEQTYARLCSNGQQNETCTALRAALMAKLSGQSQSAAPAAAPIVLPGAPSLKPAAPTGVWGFYSSLVGSKVLVTGKVVRMDALRSTEGTSTRAVGEYEWLESNRVLATRSRMIGGTIPIDAHFTYDSARGSIEQRDLAASAGTLWKIEADGSLLIASAGEGWRSEFRTTVVDDSTLRMTTLIEGSALTAASRSETIMHFTRITDAEAQALVPTARETEIALSYEKLVAANAAMRREQEVAAAAAANPKKGRGGLLRAAIGAGLGVAAGNASGMDATQTLGAAAKGVALMTPDSKVGQVIGASGDAVLQGSGLGTAPTAGGTGSAGFTKKPNLAVGNWCPGFTMQNYRTEALTKDANVQLRTMCGQAFEYYNMYENAIRQGYSEADANRTYAAHEGATRNLKAFVAGSQ